MNKSVRISRANSTYVADWSRIAIDAKIRAGWCCEHCGMEFEPHTGKATVARNADGKPSILTVHHLNGDKSDNRWENLLVCCQACHLSIQARWSPGEELPAEWPGVPG